MNFTFNVKFKMRNEKSPADHNFERENTDKSLVQKKTKANLAPCLKSHVPGAVMMKFTLISLLLIGYGKYFLVTSDILDDEIEHI